MKKDKIIYWIATGLLCFFFVAGGLMYFFNYEHAHAFFESLGFPTWIIYPLAILKLLGPIAILTRKSLLLKELAYAGFAYDAVLALSAHLMVLDGEYLPAILALLATAFSWIYDRKVFGKLTQTKPLVNKA